MHTSLSYSNGGIFFDLWPNLRFEYVNRYSFLWATSLCQRRIHISQQIMSYIDFSFFIFFSKRSQNLIFWIFIAPLGSLGGPGAPGTPGNPQNLFFTEILQKSENYINIIFFNCLHQGLFLTGSNDYTKENQNKFHLCLFFHLL